MKPTLYLIGSALVAALGGLLFGFDTAFQQRRHASLTVVEA